MEKNYEMPVAEIVEFENIFANPNNDNGFSSSIPHPPWGGGNGNIMPLD